jgi:hypothetical protein
MYLLIAAWARFNIHRFLIIRQIGKSCRKGFRAPGTVEEKIYQRQLMKGDLAKAVKAVKEGSTASFTRDELRELFTLQANTVCDTRDLMLGGQDGADWKVLDGLESCLE